MSETSYVTIRPARLADVPAMLPLLDAYARQAEILPRTEADVYQSVRDWIVAARDDTIVGMGALVILWADLAEIRSLVIDPAYQGHGIGRLIVNRLLAEAKRLELPRAFALTRRPGFFLKLGFQLTQIEKLPRKVKKDCVFCPKFHACDEVAVIMPLESWVLETQPAEVPVLSTNGVGRRPVIPIIKA